MLDFLTKICYTICVGEENDLTKEQKRQRWQDSQKAHIDVMIEKKWGPRSKASFSDFRMKKMLRKYVANQQETILKPRYYYLLSIMEVAEPQILWNELEKYMRLSNEICCKVKPSFTLEEAAVAKQASDPDLKPYICRSCGFVHFGHEPKPLKLILAKIAV